MQSITGTFEIHITIEPKDQSRLLVLIEELKQNSNYTWMIRPRMTQVAELYGEHPIQPMFACFMHGDDVAAREKLLKLADLMHTRFIRYLRVKLESSVSNHGVPSSTTTDDYYEYHFDIPIDQSFIAENWNELVQLLTPYGCHLSHNMNKQTITPIATIRHYGALSDIQDQYDKIKVVLSKNKYEIIKLQREYSVYDDNVALDKGWLYDVDPQVPITEVSDEMLFKR